MRRFLILTTFFCLFLNSAISAEETKRLALVRQIQGIEQLPSGVARQLERLSLQIVTKQPELQLLLSGDEIPDASIVNVLAVESEIAKSGTGYRIETRLLDLRKKKLLAKASHDNIREEDLIRLYQGALESLFLDQKKEELEAQEPKDRIAPPPIEKSKPNPVKVQTSAPSPDTMDFKKIVQGLKGDVDKEIAKTAESEQKRKDEKKKTPEESPLIPGKTTYNQIESFFPEPVSEGKSYPRQHKLYLGWETRDLLSEDLVKTSAKAELLTFSAKGHLPSRLFTGRLAASYDLGVSRSLSVPKPIPTPWQLGIAGTWLEKNWFTSLGFYRDSSFFFNVPKPGAGIQTSIINIMWARVQGETTIGSKYPFNIKAAIGTPMKVQTTYKALEDAKSWGGTLFQVSLTPPLVVQSWESNIMLERMNLTTEGVRPFSLNESRFILSVRRSL